MVQLDALRDRRAVELLAAARDAMVHSLRYVAFTGPILSDPHRVVDYLKFKLAEAPTERLIVLFLNSRNELIRESMVSLGSINETSIAPREVIRQAVNCCATAVIIVHNHPSGDATPSRTDIEVTKHVAAACAMVGIRLHDHIIIGRRGQTSFRALSLL